MSDDFAVVLGALDSLYHHTKDSLPPRTEAGRSELHSAGRSALNRIEARLKAAEAGVDTSGIPPRDLERARQFLAAEASKQAGELDRMTQLEAERDKAREEAERYRRAITWALGEEGDFPTRQPDEGNYWWRTELRRRAALAAREGER